MMIDFPLQKYHSFAHKYSVISKICSVSAKNMTGGVIIENQKAKHVLKISTLRKWADLMVETE
jgi:hypothetical protein